jgi:ADP-heptose:LPS heptosyltransferase
MEIAAFLSKCVAFVGLDSGISYIADAMKTPSIVIQGSTDPVTSGPISSRVIHLFADKTGYEDCQVVRCHTNCRHEINCNTSIKPWQVIEKILKIIEDRETASKVYARIVPAGV